jgi:hypothetical protein
MAGTDPFVIHWRKSSFSGTNGGDCVEVGLAWRKSSFSGENGACVEVAATPAAVLVRDTKHRDGGTLTLTPATWQALTAALTH